MVNVTYDASGSLISTYSTDPEIAPAVYDPGSIAFVLLCSALVMIMSPGIGYLYSGLLRRKNALSMLYLSLAVYAVVTFEFFFWGYSLAFSSTGGKFIGNLANFGMMNVLDAPSPGSAKIPALVYALYQSMFAAATGVILIGGAAERARLGPLLLLVFIWSTIVYNPIACATWAPNGWAFQLGALDFAGGGPVHINAGMGSLALSIFLGKRRGYGTQSLSYRPHSVSHVALGTSLLWFGWFGFNGGSALAANIRAAQASIATNLAAAVGGLTWLFIDWFYTRRWSAVSLCSGIITGLIGITPAAGYVGAPSAMAIGVISVACANYSTKLKHIFKFDDALDVFATHAVGGIVGSLLTGIFADSRVAGFDGITVIPGGWINQHYIQLAYQLANTVYIAAYSFTVTYLILFVMNRIPGLHLRATEEAEILGIDEDQCGEAGYDYAFINRDVEDPQGHKHWLDEKALAESNPVSSRGESEKSSPSNLHKTSSGGAGHSSEVHPVRETV